MTDRFTVRFVVGCVSYLMSVGISHAQVVNGDFEAGNTGFTSQYVFAPAGNSTEGQYTVRTDPQNWNGAFFAMPDHTTGSGNMMVVNGATSGNLTVWGQTISVVANTDYNFSMWVSTAVNGGPAVLDLSIGGALVGPSFTAPATRGSWAQMSRTWNSGSNTLAEIRITNSNLSTFPNDFYLDDISFATVASASAPEPGTLGLLALGGMALVYRRARRRTT